MAGLGQALTGVNQARQRSAASIPLAQMLGQLVAQQRARAAEPEGFARAAQPPQDVPLTAAERDMYARRLSQISAAGDAVPAFGGIPSVQSPFGGAAPAFERAPDERRQMDVRVGGGPPGSPERALRGLSGMIEGPEAQALAAMAGPTGAPSRRDAAPVLPRLRVLGLNRFEAPRTAAEAERMEPQLRALEQMLAQEQQRAMQQELARMRETGLFARGASTEAGREQRFETKEKAAGERFETKEQRLAREHRETLEQRGEIAGKTDETTRILRAETERHNRAMEAYRDALLDFKSKGDKRADADKFYRLVSAYSQVGLTMSDYPKQQAAIQTTLGRELEAEMRKRGFPEEITTGVVEEGPGYFERAMNWLRDAEGVEPKPKGKPAGGGATFTFRD